MNNFVERPLDGIAFWQTTTKEHSLFLNPGFTYEQQQLIDEARFFIGVFERIEEKSIEFTKNQN